MNILFFFTSFRQLQENKYQVDILNHQLSNLDKNNINVDIILHNNNSNYNNEIIKDSFNVDKLTNITCINKIEIIHTNKNTGYLWGASEALTDNFFKFKGYDYVIHLNTDVYICNMNELMQYLLDNLNNEYIFFVNNFRKNAGFKTDFTIFKPTNNVYLNYTNHNKYTINRDIPEDFLKYSIINQNIKYKILPDIFFPIHCTTIIVDHEQLKQRKIYHVHELKNMDTIIEHLLSTNK